ncbi:DUF5666 domain-containing protein [Variovorax sp. YR216]|uniref:DUF5666 domain-containing protein n=1 Tax=Variovorax sp. YR216 TaxID=1882828 RepID=UPI00089D373D|nr:DUF5666 domain-containing protein [Variovorax sp. YR216]SEA21079.1 hypothetical protein SAMN05444680_101913 [Variovorax sp. YR216]
MIINKLLRLGLLPVSLALLLSCGGGSSSPGGVSDAGGSGISSNGAAGSGYSADGSPAGDGSTSTSSSGGDGSTSTAANGNGDSGVGSGGTGVSTADAGTSVGSVDGIGSIFVGDLRYDTDQAQLDLRDTTQLQIGTTVVVTGPVDAAFTSGTARQVTSMAQMRGAVDSVDVAASSFQMLGSTVSVDANTAWADLAGLPALSAGMQVQVWALPIGPGSLRATRIESQAVAATPVVTGEVSQLDVGSSTFQLGSLVVDYRVATLPAGGLANGRIVRVSSALPPAAGRLDASQVEGWYALSSVKGAPVQLEGVIRSFASTASFSLMGTPIDASAAQVTGGQAQNLGNGVTVVASGTLSDAGVLVATKLKIRHIPGGGALPSFSLIGPITNFNSLADMTVKGQRVDASAATIVGTGQLANGVKVSVQGSQVVGGVLLATQLSFQ